jgi:hypothetical protein
MKFIIKSDNVLLKDKANELHVIDAQTGKELIENIQKDYGIKNIRTPYELQIWSNPVGYVNRKRLDLVEYFEGDDVNYAYIRVQKIINLVHPLQSVVRGTL